MPGPLISASVDGARVVTSRYMATNATVLTAGRSALVVDAPYFPDELDGLRSLAVGADVRLFATHSHFDHLLARFAFPQATLLIGRDTAEALAADPIRPVRDLEAEDARTYVNREGPLLFGALRGVPVPGWIDVGPSEAEVIGAAGHAGDGAALWAGWAGVLCCGDHLSDVEIPLVSRDGSVDGYRKTLERLAPFVERARLVVPGHGSPCSGREARRRLDADLRYLDGLAAGDPAGPLPLGRDTPRQREIHAANLEHAKRTATADAEPAAAGPEDGARVTAGTQGIDPPPGRRTAPRRKGAGAKPKAKQPTPSEPDPATTAGAPDPAPTAGEPDPTPAPAHPERPAAPEPKPDPDLTTGPGTRAVEPSRRKRR